MTRQSDKCEYGVAISHADKVLFPRDRITKHDLVSYYGRVADVILPHIQGRPLTLERFPADIDAKGFIQQSRGDHFPEWLPGTVIEHGGDTGAIAHVLCHEPCHLRYLANQDTITLHAWLSRQEQLGCPDKLILDLDPPDGGFEVVRWAASRVRRVVEQTGLTAFVKTTGSRGVHVVVPLCPDAGFERVRAAATRLAEHLVRLHPDQLTLAHRKDKRGGRLYLDVLRNAFGQTAVAPYAVRARAGAPVAVPVTWSELADPELGPQSFTIENMPARLDSIGDPWADIQDYAGSLTFLERAVV